MGKALKLAKSEQKNTDILAKRIMPKTDFNKVMEHDQLYWNTLNQYFEFSVIKSDILGKKAMKVINSQTKELIEENIDLLVEWAKTQVECLDVKGKLKIQEKLIADKKTHYDNVFLPQFEKELKEVEENFDETLKKSNQTIQDYKDGKISEKADGIIHKIKFELDWWGKVDSKDKTNEEFRLQIYKPLKRLQSALVKKLDEIKQEEKYKV